MGAGGSTHWHGRCGVTRSLRDLLLLPGNPGMSALGDRIEGIEPTDVGAVAAVAAAQRVDLVVIGPEAPLAAGLTDAFGFPPHPGVRADQGRGEAGIVEVVCQGGHATGRGSHRDRCRLRRNGRSPRPPQQWHQSLCRQGRWARRRQGRPRDRGRRRSTSLGGPLLRRRLRHGGEHRPHRGLPGGSRSLDLCLVRRSAKR